MASALESRDPFPDAESRHSAGLFGLNIFLACLAILFISTIVGFLFVRITGHETWPTDLPGPPAVLWISTVLLLMSSGTAQFAAKRASDGDRRFVIPLVATLLLGAVFLVLQIIGWQDWRASIAPQWGDETIHRLALAGFYVLTGLHALHVIGGLIPLGWFAARGAAITDPARIRSGVHFSVLYWHFLAVVWLVLFLTLLIGI